MKVEQKLKP